MRFKPTRSKPTRGRSFVTAKTFTIAMVAVNAAGFFAVQHKLKQAEVPDAFALDDGARPLLARSDTALPERVVLPEIALTASAPLPEPAPASLPAIKPLPVLDLASLELEPVASEEEATVRARKGIAMVLDKPVMARPAKRLDVVVPAPRPARVDRFSRVFGEGLDAPAPVGLTTATDMVAVTVGPESAPIEAPVAEVPTASPAEAAPSEAETTAPRLDPSAEQFFPAAPSQDTPAELPAAA